MQVTLAVIGGEGLKMSTLKPELCCREEERRWEFLEQNTFELGKFDKG